MTNIITRGYGGGDKKLSEKEKEKIYKTVLSGSDEEFSEQTYKAFQKDRITEGEFYIAMACIKLSRKK